MMPSPKPQPYASVLAIFITALLAAGGSIAYSADTQQTSEQQWCSVLGLLVARYRTPGWSAPDPAAQQFADSIIALYNDFGCADVTPLGRP